MRVGEVDIDLGCQGERGVLRHLHALVPSDRFQQLGIDVVIRASQNIAGGARLGKRGRTEAATSDGVDVSSRLLRVRRCRDATRDGVPLAVLVGLTRIHAVCSATRTR